MDHNNEAFWVVFIVSLIIIVFSILVGVDLYQPNYGEGDDLTQNKRLAIACFLLSAILMLLNLGMLVYDRGLNWTLMVFTVIFAIATVLTVIAIFLWIASGFIERWIDERPS